VQQWVDELRSRQGDPVLLQIHEHLIEDADLIRKSKVRSPDTFILNGENLRPFVFGGAVAVMEPIPRIKMFSLGNELKSTAFGKN